MKIDKEKVRTIRIVLGIILLLLAVYILSQQKDEVCFTYNGKPPIHECGSKDYITQKYGSYLGALNKTQILDFTPINLTSKNGL